MIHLEKITEDNFRECIRLKVAENQTFHVATNAVSLARAYIYYDAAAPFAVYNDDLMVGFVLLRTYKDKCYLIDQFMIDERYQGKGYGKQAMKLLIEKIEKERKYSKIILVYIEGDEIAKNLYISLGFHHTGEVDEDEVLMEMNIH